MSWSYGLIMLTAIAAGGLLLRYRQARLPLTRWQKLGLGIGGFCGAMIGAKLPFVFSDWEGMLSGAAWLSHGKTIMCGIVGGYLGVEIAKWSLDVRIKTGDTFAAPVALAVAVGRIACFFAGCCFGTATTLPWGVCFPTAPDGGTLARHPTQLYEAAFHLVCAAALMWLGGRGLLRGQLIKLYILAYLAYRFVSELIRPEQDFWLGLTAYQWAALGLAPVFALLWWRDARRGVESGGAAAPARPDSAV
jgi:phosphatidylglycerol:prolipoprotein diacylglycerol transferase